MSHVDKQKMSQMSKTYLSSAQNMQKLSTELNPQLKPGTSLIYDVLIDKEITEKTQFGDKT